MTTSVEDKTGDIVIISPQEGQSLEDYIGHDLPGLVKGKTIGLSSEDHRCIVVSLEKNYRSEKAGKALMQERISLLDQLRELGDIDVFEETHRPLIGSDFLSLGNTIVIQGVNEGGEVYFPVRRRLEIPGLTNPPAYVFGRDFVIASRSFLENYEMEGGVMVPKPHKNPEKTEETVRKFWGTLGIEKVHFLTPSTKMEFFIYDREMIPYPAFGDLDETVGSIPWLDIFTVDEEHYQQQKDTFRKIEEEEGIEFTVIPSVGIDKVYTSIYDGDLVRRKQDLWANSYLAFVKDNPAYEDSSRWRQETVVLYNRNTCITGDLIRSRIQSNQRGIHYLERDRFRLEATNHPLLANLEMARAHLRCFTHTVPDRTTYEALREKMGWNSPEGSIKVE
ncbi:MAG: hypothetical protein ACE5ES_03235 [Candidatus Nanoarchaeia archaeon]